MSEKIKKIKQNKKACLLIASALLCLMAGIAIIATSVWANSRNTIVFDLAKGNVTFFADKTYKGYDESGNELSGQHSDSNIYKVVQTKQQNTQNTQNTITIETVNLYSAGITPSNQGSIYSIVLDGVCINSSQQEHIPDGKTCEGVTTENKYYRTLGQQLNYYQNSRIWCPFLAGDDTVSVNITLVGENKLYAQPGAGATLQYAHYPMGESGNGALTVKGGGSLEVSQITKESVNRGACIGGPMLYNSSTPTGRAGNGKLVFESGTIRATTNTFSYSSAIGGASCSPAEQPIIFCGSTVIAESHNTSAVIGAGGGSTGIGEAANDIQIWGGSVTVYSPEEGVGIGAGSSRQRSGGEAKNITISGGEVLVYNANGTSFGKIGGGTSRNIGSGGEERNGGAANIIISGGKVTAGSIGGGNTNATNAKGGNATVTVKGNAEVKTDTIGGGLSISGTGGNAVVRVEGGTLAVSETIGGGNSETGNGGDASIFVSGGTLNCASIGGGNSVSGKPGSVTSNTQSAGVVVTGGTLNAGTIGGGTNENGDIGFATADISGGTIRGQFILANTDTTKQCSFKMSGGLIDNSNHGKSGGQQAQKNGGAVYLTDPNGVVEISGGKIQNCIAELGGAIYMTNGVVTISGNAEIKDCSATGTETVEARGGAIYLQDGSVNINGGTVSSCKATQGGAVYLQKGTVTVSGGSIAQNSGTTGAGAYLAGGSLTVNGGEFSNNTATENGGGAYLARGTLTINNGTFSGNRAQNGGGAYVADGMVRMFGGTVSGNTATKDGGGLCVSSGTTKADVVIRSGVISGNTAGGNGGGIAVVSGDGNTPADKITIGLLDVHKGLSLENHTFTPFGYTDSTDGKRHTHSACPKLENNKSTENGGGIYMSSSQAELDVYCLIESGNSATQDKNGAGVMACGGKVTIGDNDEGHSGKDARGNIVINSSVLVEGGDVKIYGNMQNPLFKDTIFVDIRGEAGDFHDYRIQADGDSKDYKVQYFENFTNGGTQKPSGMYSEKQYSSANTINVEGALFIHEGWKIIGWDTEQTEAAHPTASALKLTFLQYGAVTQTKR